MAKHPVAYDELIAFAAGAGPAGRHDDIAHHLDECGRCAFTVATYQRVQAMMRDDAALTPSPTVLSRIKNLMTAAPNTVPAEHTVVDAIRRVVARLVFDGRRPLATAGLRGSAGSYALVYSAGAIDVDLQIEPAVSAGKQWHITGQVSLPGDPVAAAIELTATGSLSGLRADVDETGMFSVIAGPGIFDLIVRLPDEEILLSGVSVG